MISKKLLLVLLLIFVPQILISEKKPISHDDYDIWRRLEKSQISNDGEKIFYELNPQARDSMLIFYYPEEKKEDTVKRGGSGKFSPTSEYAAFRIESHRDSVLKLRRDEAKKDEFTKDTLGILIFEINKMIKIPELVSFKIPDTDSQWMAFLTEKPELKKDTTETDSTASDSLDIAEKPDSTKTNADSTTYKPMKQEGKPLTFINPVSGDSISHENVDEYEVSENGSLFAFIVNYKDSVDTASVWIFQPEQQRKRMIFKKAGTAKKLSLDSSGTRAAFLFSEDTSDTKVYALYYWEAGGQLSKAAELGTIGIPEDWSPSINYSPNFSANGENLFFGIAEKPVEEEEDSLLADEKAVLDVWHWQDGYLQSQQLKNLSQDKKKTYLTIYKTETGKLVRLEYPEMEDVRTYDEGDAKYALGADNKPYRKYITWDWPQMEDIFLVNCENGKKRKILEKQQYNVDLSPTGKYVIYYLPMDSSWNIYSVENDTHKNITKDIPVIFCDETDDHPEDPAPYGIAGWTKDDKRVLIYDRYDIRSIDPEANEEAENLTKNGREEEIKYRYWKIEPELEFIKTDDMLLHIFDDETKEQGVSFFNANSGNAPRKELFGDYYYYGVNKAHDADEIIFRRGSYYDYPDIWLTNTDLDKPEKISDANPLTRERYWGTVELIEWTDFNGETQRGLLYKPDNFDPNNKYPMLVYFYEKYTDLKNRHYVPKPTASIIYPNLYASNGYIVFIPDISYEVGHPGKSAYNAIMSGTLHLLAQGYVDKDKIGLQGQSWGGYQTAHMVTQTPLFAAAMAGAPVSNMTSAYGGIRQGSGLSRTFQYEVGQSRIGGSLWDNLELYIENSPLFFADKVETPLLIMHNDGDGAVPFQQGIEYFNALRRLGKPVWLLNYNGDEHNLMKRANRIDLSIRMMQFFDHFLKDKPAPEWLEKGIPALEKGENDGLQLIDEK